jgi:hypothetical protein
MAQKRTNFKELLEQGEEGERYVAEALSDYDNKVVIQPLYQFNNDCAPFLIDGMSKYTSPDLMCFNQGRSFFIEVKSKRGWVCYRGRRETGFNYSSFKKYKILQEKTGIDIYVIFNHIDSEPTGLFIAELLDNTRHWDGKKPNGEKVEKEKMFYIVLFLHQI